MARYPRKTILLALIESVYGTDSTPDGDNAMLISVPQITPLNAQNVDRDLVRGFFGASEQLVGSRFVSCSFTCEFAGSGTAGTRPPVGDLLLACGFAETVEASTRVDYTPVSDGLDSVTLKWYDDGLLHALLGARGNVTFALNSGGRPELRFEFQGLYVTPSAASNPTPTGLSTFRTPLVVSEPNTGDLTLGATHSASGAPALTGGTTYPSMGLEIAMNNVIAHAPLLGGESIELSERAAQCNFQLELTAAQEATAMAAVAAATLISVGLVHGTAAGNRVLVFMPAVQRINPTKAEVAGKRMVRFDGRVTPTSSGNDEVRLAFF